ncbi:MAG TPA: hypothetical protein VGI81_03835 [Tepidisphaeraceae bacterium]|jgi:hypothetical protein
MKAIRGGSVVTVMTQPNRADVPPALARSPLYLALLMCLLSPCFGAASATQPDDWRAQFLAQAPAEYARLEATVSRWEMRYVYHHKDYPYDGTRRVVRQHTSRCRTIFDDRFGGIRSESSVIGVVPPGIVIDVVNPQYRFEADREQGRPYVISNYKQTQKGSRPWTEQLRDYRGLVAEEFGGYSLLGLIKNGGLKIKSARNVDVDGKKCIRLDFDLIWRSTRAPRTDLYPGWVVIDPSFHWAVRAYQKYNGGREMRRASIEYNPTITDVAFPKRIVEEDFGSNEKPGSQSVMDFEDPTPSHAVAKDFSLESFVTVTPPATASSPTRNIGVIVVRSAGRSWSRWSFGLPSITKQGGGRSRWAQVIRDSDAKGTARQEPRPPDFRHAPLPACHEAPAGGGIKIGWGTLHTRDVEAQCVADARTTGSAWSS